MKQKLTNTRVTDASLKAARILAAVSGKHQYQVIEEALLKEVKSQKLNLNN